MSIEDARGKAAQYRSAIFHGENPAEDRRKGRDQLLSREDRMKTHSVLAVAKEWVKRHLDVNCDWPEANRIVLKIADEWKDKLITEVTRPDVLGLLDMVIDRGSPVAANRFLSVVRPWMKWCLQRGYISTSPAEGISPPT